MSVQVVFYLACFAIAVCVFLAVARPGSFNNIYQGYGVAMMVFANSGYLALSLSKNVEEAILATKIIYIGAAYLPLLMFLIVCDLCRLKLKSFFVHILYFMQVLMYMSVLTVGYSTIYYKSVTYVNDGDGYVYLVKDYGVMHSVYMISLFLYVAGTIAIVLYSLRKKRVVCKKELDLVLMGFVAGVLGFFIERALGLRIDIMPLLYIIICLTMITPVRSSNIYTIDDKMERVTGKKSLEGYITLDNKLRYMSSNDMAKGVFPELNNYYVEEDVPRDDSNFSKIIMTFLERHLGILQNENGVNGIVNIDDKSYEIDLNWIMRRSKRVGYAVRISDVTDRQKYIKMMEQYSFQLESDVQEKTKKIQKLQQKTLLGIAEMVESRDLSTGGHIKRTSEVVKLFNKELIKANIGLDKDFLRYVARSAPMHDLGKITVDDAILRKQGKYNDAEYEVMKTHAAAGAVIVKKILTGIEENEFVKVAVNVAHYHHERVDGTGYPEGLKGSDIPIEARIMALADVFDALVSKRCYKDAFTMDKAFEIIEQEKGTHFDEDLANVFIKCRPALEKYYYSLSEDEA